MVNETPPPLGAHWDGSGVSFAVFSREAESIDVCLFASPKGPERAIAMTRGSGHIWQAYVPDIGPGQLYGLRARGPYEPWCGLRFNAHKLLIDPYARALHGRIDWRAPLHGYRRGDEARDFSFDNQDDAWGVPKCVVVDDNGFDWQGDAPPAVPWSDTVIYETHVKGLTYRHPGLPPALRGTYAGFACDAVIEHLKGLGVTAVELLPIHSFIDSRRLVDFGLVNYWGYDTLNFFTPEARYSSQGNGGAEVTEFKQMVRALHRAGIEVILDVVYNHTAETNELGPTLSFRGLDNRTYYRLNPWDNRFYENFTGTGNTINSHEPQVVKLIMDSLRYWVEQMHVDGFRFDLAPALARMSPDFDARAPFLAALYQDPVLSRVKLIAEPWDIGPGGYQLGGFPAPWAEWNDRYRDAVRRFWRGDGPTLAEMGARLAASPDVFHWSARPPIASVNFVTAHDGFTLQDLVSHSHKHNSLNREDNRDGTDENYSFNHGIEGPTSDATVLEARERGKRNLLATLLFSQGVPMLLGGDEIGRTQQGNNNAYCQDNEISWYDWDLNQRREALLAFTRRLIAARRRLPHRLFHGFMPRPGEGGREGVEVRWIGPDQEDFTAHGTVDHQLAHCFGLWTAADGVAPALILFNACGDDIDFTLPAVDGLAWSLSLDTARPDVPEGRERYSAGSRYATAARSVSLFFGEAPGESA